MNHRLSLSKNIFKLLLLSVLFSGFGIIQASEFEIQGIVKDAHTKKPISAARITVLNEKVSAVTDETGAFTVKVASAHAILVISAIEYNDREYPLQGTTKIMTELYPNNFSNYFKSIVEPDGLINNSFLTSAHKTAQIKELSNSASPDELLQSEFGGDIRTITRSGTYGMGSSLFIRGLNSVNANAQPLFVVDGIIWNNEYDVTSVHQGFFTNVLSNIDVADIESITLMKDGTAIYGTRGSNGVVFIKTKRGNGMVTKINVNIVTGFTSAPKEIPLLNADQYRIYVSDMVGTAGLTNSEISQLPYLNDNPARSTYKTYHNNTNWQNEIYQTGVTTNYGINVNGGDEKAVYYFSLSYIGNEGIVKGTDFGRYNLRLNSDVNVIKNMNIGMNIAISSINRTLSDDGINSITSPAWISKVKAPFLSPFTYTALGERTTEIAYSDIFGISNPAGVINYSNNTSKEYRFNLSLVPEYIINSDLKFKGLFDYNLHKVNEDYYRPYLYAAPVFVKRLGNSYNERESQVLRNSSLFAELKLEYNKKFADFHNLNVLLGSRYNYESFESDYVEGHNSKSNSSINLMGGFQDILTDGANNNTKYLSNFINAGYNYDNRYFVNAAVSMDASSRFGKEAEQGFNFLGQRFAIFPSINASWLVTSEKFMKAVPEINLLKIRAGYNITGNDDIQDYQSANYFTAIRLKSIANGIILSGLANPEIQWETTKRAGIGADLVLFNDRINLNADFYSSVTDNFLYLKSYQDVAGLDSYWKNGGKLSNNGFEISAAVKMLNLKNFAWETGLSAGHYENKILSMPDGENITSAYGGEVLTRVGEAAGVFYGYKTAGVFSTEKQAADAGMKIKDKTGAYKFFEAGDIIFEDFHPDGVIDEKDRQIIGNPNPDLYGTISNKFSYKNLTLNVLFSYSIGNDVYNYQRRCLESGSSYDNQTTVLLSRWTNEGQLTNQPKAVYGDPMGNSGFSDRWIEDGSYLRLKSISLNYELPLKSSLIEGVNIWCSAGNLWTLTKYLGVDPESSAMNQVIFQGIDAGLLPLTRNYNVGIRLNL